MASRLIQGTAARAATAEEIAQRIAERTRIEQLDAQILDLENTLQTLRDARNSLQQRLDGYTYPVLTLPPEIVADIFGHYLPPYPLCSRAFGPRSPTTLGRICHSWREIAFSTPTLWRSISLYLASDTDLPKRLECLQNWLTLSRSCLLSIRLEGPSQHDLDLSPFIAAIVLHSARWEYLKLDLPVDYQHHGLQGLRACDSLRSLSVCGGWWGHDWNPFTEAPQLRALGFEQFHAKPTPCFGWAQLTTLRMHLIPPPRLMDILHHAVNLVHCRLTILVEANSITDAILINPKRLLLSYLETLVVLVRDERWTVDRPALTGWFNLTTFPALRRLQVSNQLLEPKPLATLIALVSRSGCRLQQLHINDNPDPELIKECRQALPSIPSVVGWGWRIIGDLHFTHESSLLGAPTESESEDDIVSHSSEDVLSTDYGDFEYGLFA
ncbi:hypothetical protein C8R45DRAFT_505504 [Mycena sanguinolenta]|nr:hypothetical protein C8R45DRAFT_505504 [Mycena sanguinolenta]